MFWKRRLTAVRTRPKRCAGTTVEKAGVNVHTRSANEMDGSMSSWLPPTASAVGEPSPTTIRIDPTRRIRHPETVLAPAVLGHAPPLFGRATGRTLRAVSRSDTPTSARGLIADGLVRLAPTQRVAQA